MSEIYDAIIIGAGHNGLVTAGYLARAGQKVLGLERRDVVGGACVTEEVWPWYKVSTLSYLCNLLMRNIVDESPEIKTTLATDGVIGANGEPSTPGTAYILLLHGMGDAGGQRGVWGFVRAAWMVSTMRFAHSAEAHGTVIKTGIGVEKVLIKDVAA